MTRITLGSIHVNKRHLHLFDILCLNQFHLPFQPHSRLMKIGEITEVLDITVMVVYSLMDHLETNG